VSTSTFWLGLADWSKLETGSDGDFNQKQAAAFTINAEFNQVIVSKFLEICPERTAICFAQSVEQSRLLTELFNAAGILCEHLEADTPHDIRRGCINALSEVRRESLVQLAP
jgi:superfamily II DNA or RNA helicase